MTDLRESGDVTRSPAARRGLGKGVMATMPIVLAGAMTVSFNLTGPLEPVSATPKRPVNPKANQGSTLTELVAERAAAAAAAAARADVVRAAAVAAAPSSYTVRSGDTVAAIAQRFGVSTASVLALNGLGWKSLIFPGQVLKIGTAAPAAAAPAPAPAAPKPAGRYTIVAGDTISRIATKHGVSTQNLLTANGLVASSIIYPGQTIAIPGTAALAVTPVSNVTPIDESKDPASTPVVTAPAPAPATYMIKRGDTVTSISQRFAVPVPAILSANALSSTSIIYAGTKIVIPGTPGITVAQDGSSVTQLTDEMAANARIIIQIGRELGVSDRGIVIALATAMQESSLRNINYGDRDSLGLFQQRPSAGWGTPTQLTNASHATRLFFGGASNPNRGVTRGLLDIAGWQSMSLTQAAQKVQISAYPDAYAKWEKSATAWLAQLR